MKKLTLPRLRSASPRFASLLGLALASSASLAHAQTPAPAAPAAAEAPSAPATAAPTGVAIPLTPAEMEAAKAAPPAAPEAAPADAPPAAAPAEKSSADAEADAAAAAAAAAAADTATADADSGFKLNLYGFADFSYGFQFGNFAFGSDKTSFAVGKLNLYAAAELGDDWRTLAEIRFMYLPNGTTQYDPVTFVGKRTDTTVADYTDLGRPVKWGGVAIERAWLEKTFHPAVTVRVGQFLTPYGIWNVDHGSPVIIGVRRPFIVGQELLPSRQTGVEVYGALSFGPSQVGYHLTLSNGRGPIDSYQDLDHNKAIGGRLFFKHDTSKYGTLTLGTSFYKGKYTDATDTLTAQPDGSFKNVETIAAQYDEFAVAADAKWEWEGLLVQSEFITQQIAYPDGHRPSDPGFSGGPPGFVPDYRRIGVYALAGYRTPFLGIMPFFGGEHYDPGVYNFDFKADAIWGGFNVRPTPRVVLKAQYTHSWLPLNPDWGGLNAIDFQAAWSF